MQTSNVKTQGEGSTSKTLRLAGCKHFDFCALNSEPTRRGFTMVEAVVLLAMFVLIAGIVLASFPRFSQQIRLQLSSQQTALALRKTQNMAFAVRQVQTSRCGTLVPPAYGVFFDRERAPDSYLIFADLRSSSDCTSGSNDQRYRASDDEVIETIRLDQGVAINDLIVVAGGVDASETVINIVFSVPEARMTIANASGPAGESVDIVLRQSRLPDVARRITVRTSGQIAVK